MMKVDIICIWNSLVVVVCCFINNLFYYFDDIGLFDYSFNMFYYFCM